MRPFIEILPTPEGLWLVPPTATTLAGNLTLPGSVANLIVAETARRHAVELSLGSCLRAGLPITLLTQGWNA